MSWLQTIFRPAMCAAVAGLCLVLGCNGREPTLQQESKEDKHRTVAASFTGEVTDDGSPHAASLKRFFDTGSDKICSGDVAPFREVFDVRMALQLLKQQDMIPKKIDNESRLLPILESQLALRLSDPIMGVGWERYEIRRVQFIKDDVEAVAYVRHWDANDVVSKMRWWLMRDGDRWRAYDFEILEVSMRFSVMMGLGMKMADQDDPSARRLPELMSAIQTGVAGDAAAAKQILLDLEGVKFPPIMESLRLMMLAAFLVDEGAFEQALDCADRALAMNSDMPLVHIIKSACYNGLAQHKQALQASALYAKFLGKDGDYYVEVGDAYAGLGRVEEAMEAYRNGLADDAQAGNNVLGMLKIMTDQQRATVVQHYQALNGIDEWFVGFADRLLLREDAETLQKLIELHRGIMPDDENIAVYEDALADLKGDE